MFHCDVGGFSSIRFQRKVAQIHVGLFYISGGFPLSLNPVVVKKVFTGFRLRFRVYCNKLITNIIILSFGIIVSLTKELRKKNSSDGIALERNSHIWALGIKNPYKIL